MRWLSCVALLLVAGCGVKLEQGTDAPGAVDARPVDASVDGAPDAAPDARVCAGGTAHVSDPNGTCLVYFVGPKLTADAKADCVALGAKLVKIDSAATNALVTTLIGTTTALIGATDAVTEGTFLWPDGSPLTYTNWRAGEPNNGNGNYQEDCAVMAGSLGAGWDDRPCAPPPANSGSYAYVCQY